jgi:hypothetical protein
MKPSILSIICYQWTVVGMSNGKEHALTASLQWKGACSICIPAMKRSMTFILQKKQFWHHPSLHPTFYSPPFDVYVFLVVHFHNHYRNKVLRQRPIPKPMGFYRDRRLRPWPWAWPKFGR